MSAVPRRPEDIRSSGSGETKGHEVPDVGTRKGPVNTLNLWAISPVSAGFCMLHSNFLH